MPAQGTIRLLNTEMGPRMQNILACSCVQTLVMKTTPSTSIPNSWQADPHHPSQGRGAQAVGCEESPELTVTLLLGSSLTKNLF